MFTIEIKRRMYCALTFQLTEIFKETNNCFPSDLLGNEGISGWDLDFGAINTRFLVALSAADAATTVPHFPKTVSKIYHHSAIAR